MIKIKATVDVSGVLKRLERTKKELSGTSGTLYSDISKIGQNSTIQNFNAEGRPAWEARKGHYSHPILDKTGAMRDEAEASWYNWLHTKRSHVVDIFAKEYGQYHQYGVPRGSGARIAIRKFVRLLPNEIAQIITRIRRTMNGG
jgi:phage gpG-like protein